MGGSGCGGAPLLRSPPRARQLPVALARRAGRREAPAPPRRREQEEPDSQEPAAAGEQAEAGEVVVGIDLGTTNSAVAYLRGDQPRAVTLPGGKYTLPSVVYYGRDGRVHVGSEARRQAASEGQAPFYSVKRFIGRSYAACAEDRAQVPFEVREDEAGQPLLLSPHAPGAALRPQDVSAQVLRALLAAVRRRTQRSVTKAVISVPAYFDGAQRAATEEAGRLAGLQTVKLIREPVAAALGYGVRPRTAEGSVLVLDLGGGTFDVSLLEVGGGVIEVLATGGDPHLGGDDVDQAIVAWLGKEHLRGVAWRTPQALGMLTEMAQAAKVALSSAEAVKLTLPFRRGGATPQGDPQGAVSPAAEPPRTVVLTRAGLEALCAPLFRRMNQALDAACWQADIDLDKALQDERAQVKRLRGGRNQKLGNHVRPRKRDPVGEVLLVGGATRMPAFTRFVLNATNLAPKPHLVHPDLAVALGAAVHAATLEGDLKDVMVMDIWQASLMRALAKEHLRKDRAAGGEGQQGVSSEDLEEEEDDFNEEEGDGEEGQQGRGEEERERAGSRPGA